MLLAAGALAACGGSSSSGKVTLRFAWWGDATRAKVTQQAVALFEKQHPDITVQTEYAAYNPYFQKLATETAGGNTPDLLQMDYRYLNQYGKRGILLNLDPFMPGTLSLGQFNPSIAGAGKVSGQQEAVTFAQNTTAVIYDQARLTALGVPAPQPGWTWPQFQSWAQQVYQRSGGKLYGTGDMGWAEPVFEQWLIQRGKQLYTPSGQFGFTNADLAQFWSFWLGMETSGAATPAAITAKEDGTAANSPLPSRRSVADFNYDSVFNGYAAVDSDQLAMASFPVVGGSTGQYRKPAMLLSVYAHSPHAQAAVELLNFLVNDPTAGQVLGTNRGLPANLAIRQAIIPQLTAASRAVVAYESGVQSQLIGTPAAPPQGDVQVFSLFSRTYQALVFHRLSLQAAVSQFFSQGNQALTSSS
jgi:multiple sugar transport system substrate-binding protein